jgi:hypothetical protein
MDKKRRQEPQGWSEREGEGFLQRSQSRKARIESAAARRRFKTLAEDSFCARMTGMKKKLTSAKTANDPTADKALSLKAWNC